MLAATAASEEPALHPRIVFEISDRAGGWGRRKAALNLAPLPGGGTVMVIRPDGHGPSPRHGVRSAIGMAEMLAHEIKNPLAGIRGAAQLLGEGQDVHLRLDAHVLQRIAEGRDGTRLHAPVPVTGDQQRPR